MHPRIRRILATVASFVIAGILLYFSLRGIDLGAMGQALQTARYGWLIPITVVVLFSHWLRSWRWKLLLDALPETAAPGRPPLSTVRLFGAVMIGYMVNYAAPRVGEIARTAFASSSERLSFGSVLGTVVVERILDVIVLLIGLLSLFGLYKDQLSLLETYLIAPVSRVLAGTPWLVILAVLAILPAAGLYAYRSAARRKGQAPFLRRGGRLAGLLVAFRDGLYTLLRSRRRTALVLSTAAMWFCYLLMAYVPFLMLDMTATYGLTLVDAWGIMFFGALGFAIPSPGGTGSFHYITRLALTSLYTVADPVAVTYAVLAHGGQMIIYIAAGLIALIVQRRHMANVRLFEPPEEAGGRTPDAVSQLETE